MRKSTERSAVKSSRAAGPVIQQLERRWHFSAAWIAQDLNNNNSVDTIDFNMFAASQTVPAIQLSTTSGYSGGNWTGSGITSLSTIKSQVTNPYDPGAWGDAEAIILANFGRRDAGPGQ